MKKAVEHAQKAEKKIAGIRGLGEQDKKLANRSVEQVKRTEAEAIKAGEARKETARVQEKVRRRIARAEISMDDADRKS